MGVHGNATGGFGMPKTLVFVDENENELTTGVIVGEEAVFTAGLNDIRAGKIAANAEGVVTGTKDIPGARCRQASYGILPGESVTIPLSSYDLYDYTKFQCIIADFNTTLQDSVSTNKVAINDYVYEVNSTEAISQITKNIGTKSIDLNIANNSETDLIVHYFVFKEEE